MNKKILPIFAFTAVCLLSSFNTFASSDVNKTEMNPTDPTEVRFGIVYDKRTVTIAFFTPVFVYTLVDAITGEVYESVPTHIDKEVGDGALFLGQKIYSALTKVIQ